jgi:exopolysaccharide production protein ExoQ
VNPQIATVICVLGILCLFMLDRDRKARTSRALWIPVLWLMIGGSRNVGEWLQLGAPSDLSDTYVEGNSVDRNVLGAFEAIGIIVLIRRRRRVAALLRANAPLLLYFSYCAVSILWATYPYVGLKRWVRASGDVLMVLIVLTDPDCLSAIKRFLSRASFVLLPLSVLFIRYYPDLGRSFGSSDGALYWTGVTTGKNGLGMICLVFGIASVWRFLSAYRAKENPRRVHRMVAHGILIAVTVYLLWEANSMTSISCFTMATCLMVATSLKAVARRPLWVHLLIVAMVGISFCTLFIGVGGSALQAMGRDPTLTGRTDVWKMVLQFAGNPIFGAGYESFWVGERIERIHRLNPGINQAHNGYIEVYLNLGWIGVILMAGIIVTGYRRVVAGFRRDPDLGRLRLAYFLAAVIYNFTEAGIKMMSPVWITFLVAIVMMPRLIPRKAQAISPKAPEDRLRVDSGAAVLQMSWEQA